MKIRKCTTKNLNRVIEIERKSFKYPYPPSLFRWYMRNGLFLVAEENEKIVGYVIGMKKGLKEKKEEESKGGLIASIAVLPNFRRKGIGTSLMEKMMEKMEEVKVQVRKSNRAAIKFYKKLGFIKKGFIENCYQDGEDAIVMKKG